jgi:hypothetical protein
MHQIYYHYSLAPVPVLASATVVAVGRLRTPVRRRVATACALGAAIASSAVWGVAPFTVPSVDPGSPQVVATNALLRRVPAHAVVSASWPVVAHLTHRVRVYQWPTPFRATVWGLYDREGQRLPSAPTVQYLVIPTVRHGTDAAVFATIGSRFAPVGSAGGWTVYRRLGG